MNQSDIAAQEIAINGARYLPGFLSPSLQRLLLDRVRRIIGTAPLFQPAMPRTGKPFSVRMSNCGPLGWVSDKQNGYRYQPVHPQTGEPWPAMPPELFDCWRQLTDYPGLPQACLINFYDASARMGQHRDQDEADMDAPVISLSLGDAARFRIGGKTRRDPSQ
ncbi:MAG: alpha-ketoglutarate-dependent dioxygenase AlkB, partial [Fimbriimonadaceae bacterium]|nr:alpha-ketoglutarate-dependent dioxygenase AlkB [Alphaproteobacteria bacterium]